MPTLSDTILKKCFLDTTQSAEYPKESSVMVFKPAPVSGSGKVVP